MHWSGEARECGRRPLRGVKKICTFCRKSAHLKYYPLPIFCYGVPECKDRSTLARRHCQRHIFNGTVAWVHSVTWVRLQRQKCKGNAIVERKWVKLQGCTARVEGQRNRDKGTGSNAQGHVNRDKGVGPREKEQGYRDKGIWALIRGQWYRGKNTQGQRVSEETGKVMRAQG